MNAVNTTPGNAGTVGKHPGILYPLMLIAAITVIVFSFAGIATMMGWLPGAPSQGRPLERSESPALRHAAESLRAAALVPAAACADDCGVVESISAVEAKRESSYQIRVRMSDGTTRTFHEHAQPALAVGQKVRVTGHGVIAAG